jgi:hypothetical protein
MVVASTLVDPKQGSETTVAHGSAAALHITTGLTAVGVPAQQQTNPAWAAACLVLSRSRYPQSCRGVSDRGLGSITTWSDTRQSVPDRRSLQCVLIAFQKSHFIISNVLIGEAEHFSHKAFRLTS